VVAESVMVSAMSERQAVSASSRRSSTASWPFQELKLRTVANAGVASGSVSSAMPAAAANVVRDCPLPRTSSRRCPNIPASSGTGVTTSLPESLMSTCEMPATTTPSALVTNRRRPAARAQDGIACSSSPWMCALESSAGFWSSRSIKTSAQASICLVMSKIACRR
jgi:hypothetical protein